MENIVRLVRVVLVSPGDVRSERAAAVAVVEELNRGEASARGVQLSLWRWETDARPGLHLQGPQGQIDEQMRLDATALVVGVFWKRFGTPTSDSESGTEHELRRAIAAWQQHQSPEVMVYFCERPYAPSQQDELEQWGRVLGLRAELDALALTARYETQEDFTRLLREHLGRFVRHDVTPVASSSAPAARTTAEPSLRFNVPPEAIAFAGRSGELDAIREALGVTDRAVITQAITGLGGVGKSQLAARYVRSVADDYDVVAWIRAQDGGIADLADLAARLGQPVEGLTPSERAQRALDWLAGSTQRWLLALDNVESPDQLERLLPRGGHGRVLITSRDRALNEYAPVLAIDVFDEDTATSYLIDRAGRPGDERAARTLAVALGRLPLALTHAAAYCRNGTSFSDYQQRLGALPARELFTSHPERSYAQTVASTWKTSIQAATADAPLAASMLEMASYLGPDAIPTALFGVLVDDASSVAAQHRLTVAFNALARYSLITVEDSALNVHRLLQKTVRDDNLARADQRAARDAVRGIDTAFASLEDTALPGTWLLCEQLLPHALALAVTITDPGEQAAHLIGVLNRVSRYLYYAGGGRRAVTTAETIKGHAERLLDPEDPATLTARANLAFSLRSAGRIQEAVTLGERVLADTERILGSEHPDTLFAGTDLANSLTSAGRAIEAIALGERVVTSRERILGPEHPDTLTARSNLANSYRSAGRTKDAIALQEGVLVDSERILGPEHPETLTARSLLANSYFSAGRTKDAIALQEGVLVDSERILGPEHPETLSARGNLANSYRSAGRTKDAIALQEGVLVDRERILGPEHPATLTNRSLLANAYFSAGRTKDAIALQEGVLVDSERILGPEHPETLSARGNLANSYFSAGRTKDAIALQEGVLVDSERILGPEHPETLTARGNLANSYRSAGRTKDAIALQEGVLADSERILGPEHPATLTTRSLLANAYFSAGRTKDAIALQEGVLVDRERILGPEHPDTLTTRSNLAAMYRQLGRVGAALALERRQPGRRARKRSRG